MNRRHISNSKNPHRFVFSKMAVWLWFLWFLGLSQNTLGQQYIKIKDNSGYSSSDIGRLDAAAGNLINILPASFKSDFKVYGSGYYLHLPATKDGLPPISQLLQQETAVSSPYYLLFAKETTPNGLYGKIKVHIKLPATSVWGCLDDAKKAFIAEELQEVVNGAYAAKGGQPSFAAEAEIAGIEKLQRYIEKAIDCCQNRSPAACSLCPDTDIAKRAKRFFEDSIHTVKIPIKIAPGSTAAADRPIPTKQTGEENFLPGGVVSKTDLRVSFGPGEPGLLASSMTSVFNSEVFSGVSTQGFVTSNENLCKPDFKLWAIKAQYEDPSIQTAIWAHIWSDPDDPSGQAFLYLAARTIGRENLSAAGSADVVAMLNASYGVNDHTYGSKFLQSTSVLFFYAASVCDMIQGNEADFVPADYNAPSYMSQICAGGGALSAPAIFLSPACQPIYLPTGAIPAFSKEVADRWKFDKKAIYGFFANQGRWVGCVQNEQTFMGFYRPLGSLTAYASGVAPGTSSMVVRTGEEGTDGTLQLTQYNYTPPASRPLSTKANGPLLPSFDGLSNPSVLYIYQYDPKTIPQLKSLYDGSFQVLWDIKGGGTIMKVGTGSSTKYLMIKFSPGAGANLYYEFDCGRGGWTQIPKDSFNFKNTLTLPYVGQLIIDNQYLNNLINSGKLTQHTLLEVAGSIPIVGTLFDAADVILYCVEGNNQGAILASLAFIPLAGDLASQGKALLKSGGGALEIPIFPGKKIENPQTNSIWFFRKCANRPNKGSDAEFMPPPCHLTPIEIDLNAIGKRAGDLKSTKEEYDDLLAELVAPDAQGKKAVLAELIADNPNLDIVDAWVYLHRGNLPTNDFIKLKKLAEDLKSSATFAAALAGDRELVKAWEAVEGMPASIRRDVFTIETVARHITETGKSPAAIAAELTASGTYDNWLADHLVTYLKNGHTLDKSSIDGAFATHIDVVETVSSNSVSGGHNRLAFLAECHVNNPTKRVVIISPRPLPSPPQAWEKFEYKTLTADAINNPSIITRDAAGNITGPFNSPNSQTGQFKTVYDPSQVSADNVKEMGYKAYKQAIDNNGFIHPPGNLFQEAVDGKIIEGYFEIGTNKIRTWYIKL